MKEMVLTTTKATDPLEGETTATVVRLRRATMGTACLRLDPKVPMDRLGDTEDLRLPCRRNLPNNLLRRRWELAWTKRRKSKRCVARCFLGGLEADSGSQLLASLNRAGGAPPGGPPMQNGPPPSQPYMPPQQQQQPPPQQPPYQAPYGDYGGYQQGPPPGPSQPPPGQFSPPPPTQPSAYRSVDPRQAPHAQAPPPSAPAPPTAPASSLPPAILALLSAAGGSKPPGQPGIPAGSALPGNLSPGKPPALSTPGPAPAVPAAAPGQPNNQAVQQLLALLVSFPPASRRSPCSCLLSSRAATAIAATMTNDTSKCSNAMCSTTTCDARSCCGIVHTMPKSKRKRPSTDQS